MKNQIKKRKVLWYAKGGGIAKCGPFKSQIEATNAMRLITPPRASSNFRERLDMSLFPADVFVWPELAKR